MTDIGALLRRRASDRVSVSLPADPVLLDAGVAAELTPRRQRAGQRRVARRPRCPRVRAGGGSRRLGHGEHPRRRRRHRRRPAGGGGRRGSGRYREIDCGTDELARWQREAEHRAGMWDGMGADRYPDGDGGRRPSDLAGRGGPRSRRGRLHRGRHRRRRRRGPPPGRGRATRRGGDGHAAVRRRRRPGHRRGAGGVAVVADPGAVGLRRTRRRAGGGEGRRHRLSGQERVEARTRRRGARHGGGPRGVHPGTGRAGAGGVPAHRAVRTRARRTSTEPDRARDRGPALRREGFDRQADRRPAVAEPPHGGEPRAGDVPQASGRQPRRVGPLRDRARADKGTE